MAVEDVDGRNAAALRRRCFCVARWVVALAMTAVILAVLAHAIRVLLRSQDDLFLQVDKSFVAVDREQSNLLQLMFSLDLQVANPSSRVAIYYENIVAYLYGAVDNASDAAYFVSIPIRDISLKQELREFESLRSYPFLNTPDCKPYFDLFTSSGNNGIPRGVVTVNGTLTIAKSWYYNHTGKAATYYCWPVAIGGDPSAEENTAECMDNPPTVEASLDKLKPFVL